MVEVASTKQSQNSQSESRFSAVAGNLVTRTVTRNDARYSGSLAGDGG
jgi:hypothetical protein